MWLHRRAAHLLLLISVLGMPLLARGQQCASPQGVAPQVVVDSGGSPIRDPANLVNVGGTLFFTLGAPGPGITLWKSNGTQTGTVPVQPVTGWPSNASLSHFTAVGNRLYFAAANPSPVNSDDLWTSDGTNARTEALGSFAAGGLGLQSEFVAVVDQLFFSANGLNKGFELWSSGGSRNSTTLVRDIWQDSPSSNPSSLTVMNGQLFFVADDGSKGEELWRHTATDTVRMTDLNPSGSSLATSLTVVGDMLYFTAFDGTGTVTLWKSNGADVPVKVAPNNLACSVESPSNLTAVGDKLFFRCADSTSGAELWVTDGTEEGTHLVKDIQSGPSGSDPHKLVAVGDTLFFVANDGVHGAELWRSDGTDAGTLLVRDFYPGSSTPSEPTLMAGPGVLVAQITDDVSGSELWKVDATEATQLANIAPGAASSSPRSMTISGDKLYFVATDPVLGNVLYMLALKQVDCSKPNLECPPNQTVEAVSPAGAVYTSLPYQVDDDSLAEPEILGKEQLQGLFGMGDTPITLQAMDLAGNPSESCSFTITVRDTTQPFLACPDEVKQEATGPKTRSFFFVAASDAVKPQLTVDYGGHPPGSEFDQGPTPVNVSVSDGVNEPSTCTILVIIHDSVAPRITCPLDIVREAKTADDLIVDYASSVKVMDVGSPGLEAIAEPAGSQFPVGETEVTLTARDAAGNNALPCSFWVRIKDLEPPTLSCPGPVKVAASRPEGAEVSFQAVPDDNLGADRVDVNYSQDPETLFPVGETLVTATATDDGGNSVSCTFPVTVTEYIVSDGACQAGGSGGAVGWLLLVLLPVWARRRAARVAR